MTSKAVTLEEKIRGLCVSLETSHLEISAVKKHASDLESDMKEKSNEMNAMMMKNTELIVASAAKDQEIKILREQAEKDRNTIGTLSTSLTDLEAALKQAQSELTEESSKTNDMAVSIALVEKQTASLKAQTITDSEIISQLKSQIADLQATSTSTVAEMKAYATGKSEAEEKLASLAAKSAKDDDELTARKHQIAALEAGLAQSNSALAVLKAQVANLVASAEGNEKKMSFLTSQTQRDEAELQSLRKQIQDLTASIETAYSDTTNLKASLRSTSDMLDASTKQVSILMADQAKVHEERAALQSSIAQLKDVDEAQRNELQLLLTQQEQSLIELGQKMLNVRPGNLDVLVDHTGTGRAAKVLLQSIHPINITLTSSLSYPLNTSFQHTLNTTN